MCADFSSTFFDYPDVQVHERAEDLVFLATRPESDWSKLLAQTDTRRFSKGDVIIAAGDVDRALYLLTEGSLGMRLPGQEHSTFKAIDAPSVVGEVAFLDGGPRSASLYALTDGELMRLSMDAFEVLAAREPELGRAILLDLGRIVAARLRLLTEQMGG